MSESETSPAIDQEKNRLCQKISKVTQIQILEMLILSEEFIHDMLGLNKPKKNWKELIRQ